MRNSNTFKEGAIDDPKKMLLKALRFKLYAFDIVA